MYVGLMGRITIKCETSLLFNNDEIEWFMN